jgi:predicted nuclease with TOPRIM domain
MISLEQVLLLETRVAKAIDYVKKITAENAELVSKNEELKAKLEANQKRIDELEVHVMRFKEDQSRIEDGIIAALDRLSQFEDAFENTLKDSPPAKKPPVRNENSAEPPSQEVFFEIPAQETEVIEPKASSTEGELDIF